MAERRPVQVLSGAAEPMLGLQRLQSPSHGRGGISAESSGTPGEVTHVSSLGRSHDDGAPPLSGVGFGHSGHGSTGDDGAPLTPEPAEQDESWVDFVRRQPSHSVTVVPTHKPLSVCTRMMTLQDLAFAQAPRTLATTGGYGSSHDDDDDGFASATPGDDEEGAAIERDIAAFMRMCSTAPPLHCAQLPPSSPSNASPPPPTAAVAPSVVAAAATAAAKPDQQQQQPWLFALVKPTRPA